MAEFFEDDLVHKDTFNDAFPRSLEIGCFTTIHAQPKAFLTTNFFQFGITEQKPVTKQYLSKNILHIPNVFKDDFPFVSNMFDLSYMYNSSIGSVLLYKVLNDEYKKLKEFNHFFKECYRTLKKNRTLIINVNIFKKYGGWTSDDVIKFFNHSMDSFLNWEIRKTEIKERINKEKRIEEQRIYIMMIKRL